MRSEVYSPLLYSRISRNYAANKIYERLQRHMGSKNKKAFCLKMKVRAIFSLPYGVLGRPFCTLRVYRLVFRIRALLESASPRKYCSANGNAASLLLHDQEDPGSIPLLHSSADFFCVINECISCNYAQRVSVSPLSERFGFCHSNSKHN